MQKYESTASSVRGLISGALLKFSKDADAGVIYSPKELQITFRELLSKFNQLYPQKIVKNEIEIIDGWKGKDNLEFYKGFEDDFIIKEHIKDKNTGEVKEVIKTIKKQDVNRMLFIIKNLERGVEYKCYYISKKLGYEWKNLWKERKIYFEIYYYPIKVIEAMNLIRYGGRGTIERIK